MSHVVTAPISSSQVGRLPSLVEVSALARYLNRSSHLEDLDVPFDVLDYGDRIC